MLEGTSSLVNLSVDSRDQHSASFETAASRLPQDEVFLNAIAIDKVSHPEERSEGASRRTHHVDAATVFQLAGSHAMATFSCSAKARSTSSLNSSVSFRRNATDSGANGSRGRGRSIATISLIRRGRAAPTTTRSANAIIESFQLFSTKSPAQCLVVPPMQRVKCV